MTLVGNITSFIFAEQGYLLQHANGLAAGKVIPGLFEEISLAVRTLAEGFTEESLRGEILLRTGQMADENREEVAIQRLAELLNGVDAGQYTVAAKRAKAEFQFGHSRFRPEKRPPHGLEIYRAFLTQFNFEKRYEGEERIAQIVRLFDVVDEVADEWRKRVWGIAERKSSLQAVIDWEKRELKRLPKVASKLMEGPIDADMGASFISSLYQPIAFINLGYLKILQECLEADEFAETLALISAAVDSPKPLEITGRLLQYPQSRGEIVAYFLRPLLEGEGIELTWEGERLVISCPSYPNPYKENPVNPLKRLDWENDFQSSYLWQKYLEVLGWNIQVQRTNGTIRLTINFGKHLIGRGELAPLGLYGEDFPDLLKNLIPLACR